MQKKYCKIDNGAVKVKKKEANVEELIKRLPKGYEKASQATGAIGRKREIKNPVDLMQLVIL